MGVCVCLNYTARCFLSLLTNGDKASECIRAATSAEKIVQILVRQLETVSETDSFLVDRPTPEVEIEKDKER